jgi:hypothetical protein
VHPAVVDRHDPQARGKARTSGAAAVRRLRQPPVGYNGGPSCYTHTAPPPGRAWGSLPPLIARTIQGNGASEPGHSGIPLRRPTAPATAKTPAPPRGSPRRRRLQRDSAVRDQVRTGPSARRPAGDLGRIEWVECTTGKQGRGRRRRGRGVDAVVLDGEAWPTGRHGLAKQMKDELPDCPPVCVLIARRDDRWLATWSQADAVVAHPIDAPELTGASPSCCAGARPGCRCAAPSTDVAHVTALAGAARLAAARRGPEHGGHRLGDGRGDGRRGHARPGRRLRRRAAREGGDARRGRRAGRGRCWPPRRRCR